MHPELLKANFRKVGIEMLRYLPNTISLIVTFYAIFLAMFFGIQVVGDPASAAENVRFLIVSNAFWLLLLLGISSMGWEVTAEATRGTLEQLYMSPMAAWQILLARMIGTLGINLLILMLMIFLGMLTAGQWLNLSPIPILLVLAPTLVSVIGLGYVAAGLALVFKQVNSLLQILQFVFLALAFVPLAAAPWLEFAPVVKGIDLVRGMMVAGHGLADMTALDWLSLALNAAVYFSLGLGVFLLCERRAMRRGLLGQY